MNLARIVKIYGVLALFVGVLAGQAHAFGDVEFSPDWNLHLQSTVVTQAHGAIRALYSGANSLVANQENRTSITETLFLGRKLWSGGAIFFNPELSGGSGLSDTHGIAGYPNGEVYRVDSPDPKGSVARIFLQQIFGLGPETEKLEVDSNQFAGPVPEPRITVVVGRFSLNDYFDDNSYSHDPRTQFLNWVFMDNGAWDYAADTKGYTWGFYLEYNQARWALRLASALEPKVANQLQMDPNVLHAHGDNLEFEYRYKISDHRGKWRALAYMNHAHMGDYAQSLATASVNPDITSSEQYRTKYGLALNIEQEISADLGFFSRWGWNDGKTETWAFTEIDRTFSLGVSLKGGLWSRPKDTLGLALALNGISGVHAAYLKAGGYGFLIGDGHLDEASEQIAEIYYAFQIIRDLTLSADFQFVNNPAYNSDRGPVSIWGARLHYEL